jgi:hypothetical protein
MTSSSGDVATSSYLLSIPYRLTSPLIDLSPSLHDFTHISQLTMSRTTTYTQTEVQDEGYGPATDELNEAFKDGKMMLNSKDVSILTHTGKHVPCSVPIVFTAHGTMMRRLTLAGNVQIREEERRRPQPGCVRPTTFPVYMRVKLTE